MKELEQNSARLGIGYLRLMENAGSAAAVSICSKIDVRGRHCAVVAGKGNNGGDAFVVARKLFEREALVCVILANDLPATEESRENLDRLLRLGVEVIPYDPENPAAVRKIDTADLIVDGIFGTGFSGEIPMSMAGLFDRINHSIAAVFSLDVPSGVNAQNGAVAEGAIRADFTVAFHGVKAGCLYHPAKEYMGEWESVGIGLHEESGLEDGFLIQEADIFETLQKRPADSHKGNFGHLLQICGSIGFSGAALLSAMGALRIGTGLLTCASPASVLTAVNVRLPEAMTLPLSLDSEGNIHSANIGKLIRALDGKSTCLMGCGIGVGKSQKEILREVLQKSCCPIVLDADGINNLASDISILKQAEVPVILTPHPGEMARLLSCSVAELKKDRFEAVKTFCAAYGVIVVLKDSVTTIFEPGGTFFVSSTGNAGLAKGGSGDLLAGMISGLCAQGYPPLKSAVCGVYLHGMAADRCAVRLGQYSMLPSDILQDLADLFAQKGL